MVDVYLKICCGYVSTCFVYSDMISIHLDMTQVLVVDAVLKFHEISVSISKTQQTYCDSEPLFEKNTSN